MHRKIAQKNFWEIKILIKKRFLLKATSHKDHYIHDKYGQSKTEGWR